MLATELFLKEYILRMLNVKNNVFIRIIKDSNTEIFIRKACLVSKIQKNIYIMTVFKGFLKSAVM